MANQHAKLAARWRDFIKMDAIFKMATANADTAHATALASLVQSAFDEVAEDVLEDWRSRRVLQSLSNLLEKTMHFVEYAPNSNGQPGVYIPGEYCFYPARTTESEF